MRESDKVCLDRLQARLTGRIGRRITKRVPLARLVALGEAEIDRLPEPGGKSPERNLEKLWALPLRTGLKTREEDIDAALHGARK